MKRLVLTAALLFVAGYAYAGSQWEYKMVYLTVWGEEMESFAIPKRLEEVVAVDGGWYVDPTRTRMLNELAADGWELITVVGSAGGEHGAYLRRQVAATD